MRNKLAAIIATIFVGVLASAGTAVAWHINSGCNDTLQWVVGIPNESWANGTTATLNFDQGPSTTATKGQSRVAPAAATSVVVTFSNSEETLHATRPRGCVQPTPTTTTVVPTTTTVPTPTTTTTQPPPSTTIDVPTTTTAVAVDEPPVPVSTPTPALQGTLPATGRSLDVALIATVLLVLGIGGVVVAARRQS